MTTGRPSGRGAPGIERGAALLTALVSIAVLTALAVDLAYQSRVSLNIAANARDELRAQYLARSGVAMGRLILSFQQKLDQTMGQATSIPRVQLWNLVPVDQSLVDGLFSGIAAAPSKLAVEGQRPAAAGATFDATIEDEGRKVNAQFFGFTSGSDTTLRQRVQSVYQLICDGRWDALFEREDANGLRSTREDILVRLRDWVDEGSVTSELGIAGGAGAQCGLVIGQPPFVDAFGDENQPYDRGEERYKTKNAPMDSLDELYLVAGIGDAFMAAFGDSLTVYLRSGDKQNVNVLEKDKLVALAGVIANPPGQPALLDPEFGNRLAKAVRERTLNGILSITPKELGALVALSGVNVNQNLLADNSPNSPFTDRSTVFRIRASGKVGAVRSSIDAVVRLDQQRLVGDQLAVPGRIIHWRED
jgi:general secretion pathway protein K